MPITTAGVVIEKDGKFLLLKRKIGNFTGFWCIPGGWIDNGETAKTTAVREFKEEVGLELKNPKFVCYHDEIFPERKWFGVVLLFSGEIQGEIKLSEEHSEYGWFTIEEMKSMKIAFGNEKAIEKFLKMK